ncbi:hypothetical protein [Chryseosolibacter indicus]|uniref:Uncharacterized protein n=1 Tax=Chryseosolibacter indicus TaxID=2782351 RepID=A0ABS5VTR8_9BACT|nr:hypothetical protein [Chryseosolibacter indicus]MBT1704453.1 hypothetical protein [Chryseosolibacter indicus]
MTGDLEEIQGILNLASGMGVFETNKAIASGINGAEVNTINYDHFNEDMRDKLAESDDWFQERTTRGNNIVIY